MSLWHANPQGLPGPRPPVLPSVSVNRAPLVPVLPQQLTPLSSDPRLTLPQVSGRRPCQGRVISHVRTDLILLTRASADEHRDLPRPPAAADKAAMNTSRPTRPSPCMQFLGTHTCIRGSNGDPALGFRETPVLFSAATAPRGIPAGRARGSRLLTPSQPLIQPRGHSSRGSGCDKVLLGL